MQLTQTKWLWTLLFAFWSYQLQATIIYVDYQATGSNNGTSWTNAYTDFNTALLSATFGDEIRVAEGNYLAPSGGFILKDGVRINGGYPSATRYPIWLVESLRSYTTYPTYLEAINSGSQTTLRQTTNLSSQTRLDGLHVKGNEALRIENNQSGTVVNTQIVVTNVIFEDGDRILVTPENLILKPTFQNCEFKNFNLFVSGTLNPQDDWAPKFNNCQFTDFDQWPTYSMFRIVVEGGRFSPEISNCEFNNNDRIFGVDVSNFLGNGGGTVEIEVVNSLFVNNVTVLWIELSHLPASFDNNFTNCTFYGNGKIDESLHSLVVEDISFSAAASWPLQNQPTDTNPLTVMSFENCVSWNNLNKIGKLIWLDSGLHVNVQNSLLEASSFNSSGTSSDPVFSIPNPHPTINRVRDLGGNILNQNPQFVNPTAATPNLRLQASSPARNTGNNSLVPAGVTTDISVNNRILESTVEMGAYEFCTSGDGSCNTTGVPVGPMSELQLTESEMIVYPNPVKEVIHLQTDKEVKVYSTTLTSLQGEVLKTWQTATHLEVAALEKGLYILKLETNKGVETIRIIKE